MKRGIGRASLPTHLDMLSLALLEQRLGQGGLGLVETLLIDERSGGLGSLPDHKNYTSKAWGNNEVAFKLSETYRSRRRCEKGRKYIIINDERERAQRVPPDNKNGDLAEGLPLPLRLRVQQNRHLNAGSLRPRGEVPLHLPQQLQ